MSGRVHILTQQNRMRNLLRKKKWNLREANTTQCSRGREMQYEWMCVVAVPIQTALCYSKIICSTLYWLWQRLATGRLGHRKFIGMTALYAHRSCQMAECYIIMYVFCFCVCECIECIPNKCSHLLSQLIIKCGRRHRLLTHCDSESTKMVGILSTTTTDITRANMVTRWIIEMRTASNVLFVRWIQTVLQFRAVVISMWMIVISIEINFRPKNDFFFAWKSNRKMLPKKITKKHVERSRLIWGGSEDDERIDQYRSRSPI